MWYGSAKVGIPEIDLEHSNLDTMLQLYFSGAVPETYLENIVIGVERHFEHEAQLIEELGATFPPEHRVAHQGICEKLERRLREVSANLVDGGVVAEEIRALLLLHVVEYDIELKKLIPD